MQKHYELVTAWSTKTRASYLFHSIREDTRYQPLSFLNPPPPHTHTSSYPHLSQTPISLSNSNFQITLILEIPISHPIQQVPFLSHSPFHPTNLPSRQFTISKTTHFQKYTSPFIHCKQPQSYILAHFYVQQPPAILSTATAAAHYPFFCNRDSIFNGYIKRQLYSSQPLIKLLLLTNITILISVKLHQDIYQLWLLWLNQLELLMYCNDLYKLVDGADPSSSLIPTGS